MIINITQGPSVTRFELQPGVGIKVSKIIGLSDDIAYWFADSYKDIAKFMGLSEKNISVRLTRIREKMKQYLIEREVFV